MGLPRLPQIAIRVFSLAFTPTAIAYPPAAIVAPYRISHSGNFTFFEIFTLPPVNRFTRPNRLYTIIPAPLAQPVPIHT